MSDILLIQPPQWYPVSPYLAVPLLAAQLKKADFNVKTVDLNIRFYNSILTESHLSSCYETAKELLSSLSQKFIEADAEVLREKGTYEEKTEYLKFITISSFLKEYSDEIPYIIAKVEEAVNTTKTKADFYIPEKLAEAKHIIKLALRIASLPYAPNEIDFDNYYSNPVAPLDWVAVKSQAEDPSVNMFYDFFHRFTESTDLDKYDIIALSMTDLSQLIPVFTLSEMLRKHTKAKIILGGNYATQIHKEIMKHPDIFTDFIDYLVIGDGELSLINLCKHLSGRQDFENLSNLICLNNKNEVISTGFNCNRLDMDSLAYPDFSDYDFSEYFTPQPTFPIQLSKGCYWGKCNFCDYPYGQQGYHPKHIDRIIDEIKYFVNTYNASRFMFVDEAIPPKFYNALALAIIKEGLDITFYSFARLETEYTPEVLSNLQRAGARLFLWGYECSSPRIMEKMNKGIDVSKRLDILRDSRNAGIWNNGLFMFGYPTETLDETKETMRIIKEYRDIIPSCTLSNFSLKKNSRLIETIGENGVQSFTSAGEFYIVCKDVIDGISQSDRRSLRRNFQFEFLQENANRLWPVIFSDFDHLLLYLSEYGYEYVSSYRSDKKVCPEFR